MNVRADGHRVQRHPGAPAPRVAAPASRSPLEGRLRLARRLASTSAAGMAAAAVVGLVSEGLYQEAAGLRHLLRGHDAVTAVVVVPLLVAGILADRRAAAAGRPLWLGAMAFATYNYSLYVFGTTFNDLFLLHIVIFETSAVALVLGLTATEWRDPGVTRGRARVAAGLVAFLAIGLGAMWAFQALRFAFTGVVPLDSALVLPPAATHLGYALDLTLIVPAYGASALLLWRHSGWGFGLAPVLLIGGLLQQMTYLAALVFQSRAGVPGAVSFDVGEPIVIAAYAVALLLLRPPPAGAAR